MSAADPNPPIATQKKLDKLKAMRAKAEGLLAQDPDDPEGLIFQEQYLKLLVRYQLDPASLDRTDRPAEEVIADSLDIPGGAWDSKRTMLVGAVCQVFRVPHIIGRNTDRTRTVLMTGTPTTLAAAKQVCEHLMPQMAHVVIRAKAHPMYLAETPSGRRLFVSGALDSWVAGVMHRVAALYREAEAETPASATGKDLAVVDKAVQLMQELTDFMRNEMGVSEGRALDAPSVHHAQALVIGRDAAARADLGQASTGGTTGPGPLAVGA
jgi:hypothetical protein